MFTKDFSAAISVLRTLSTCVGCITEKRPQWWCWLFPGQYLLIQSAGHNAVNRHKQTLQRTSLPVYCLS